MIAFVALMVVGCALVTAGVTHAETGFVPLVPATSPATSAAISKRLVTALTKHRWSQRGDGGTYPAVHRTRVWSERDARRLGPGLRARSLGDHVAAQRL